MAIAMKFVPMVEVAKCKGWVFVIVVVVPLTKAAVPVRLLLLPFVVKSIEVPAFKVVVPGTTTEPVWLIAAPAAKDKLPLLFRVRVGKIIFAEALLKFTVKLRK